MIFRRSLGWSIVGWTVAAFAILVVAAIIVGIVQMEKREEARKREEAKVTATQPKLTPRCPPGYLVHDGSYGYGNKPICLPGVTPTMEPQP